MTTALPDGAATAAGGSRGGAPEEGRTGIARPQRIALTVEEAAECLGIGRTLMYSLVSSGAVESVTIGRLRRIPADALARYIERLRAAGKAGEAA
jgi:excisionase family DNA binding protein